MVSKSIANFEKAIIKIKNFFQIKGININFKCLMDLTKNENFKKVKIDSQTYTQKQKRYNF